MNILTENQIRILRLISQVPLLKDNFYLTGGTALSAFYLQHRYSEDLDFFTSNNRVISNAVAAFIAALNQSKVKHSVIRMFDTFTEIHIHAGSETIKMDFALDSPYRLQKVKLVDDVGIFIDNERDISCNKLSALFDRADPKDFVDIFFVHHNLMPVEDVIVSTKKKHVGLDNYWLARAFFKVQEVGFLPRMVKPVTIDELKLFFLSYATKLMEEK
jgi:predicted nucleotidyltransferase component of viral defense system